MASAGSSSAFAFAAASMDVPRELLRLRARIALVTGHFGDALEIMHVIFKRYVDVTQEEHNLLVCVYDKYLSQMNSSLAALRWMEMDEKYIAFMEETKTCRESIESKLGNFCTSEIDHLKTNVIPYSVGVENGVFCHKLEADFFWLKGQLQHGSERMLSFEKSAKAYEIAEEQAKWSLPPNNSTRLLIAFNHCMLHKYMAGPCERSLEIAKGALCDALVGTNTNLCTESEVLLEDLKENMIVCTVDIAIKAMLNELMNEHEEVLIIKSDHKLEEQTSAVVKSYLTPYQPAAPVTVRRLTAPSVDEDAFVSPPPYMPAESAKEIRARRKRASCSRGQMG